MYTSGYFGVPIATVTQLPASVTLCDLALYKRASRTVVTVVVTPAVTTQQSGKTELEWLDWHATAIPSRIYPFSSDQGSQTGLGSTSTRLSVV